jgi:uncharacterized membrane protein YdjX (TVP38/TMEM64 family)
MPWINKGLTKRYLFSIITWREREVGRIVRKKIIKILSIIAAIVIVVMMIEKYMDICLYCIDFHKLTPQNIKDFLLQFGNMALLVYITLYWANTVSLLPPIGIMSLAAGFIFGPFWGTIGIMAGAFLGTSTTFIISRLLGRRFVDKLVKGKGKEFEEKLNRKGFVTILFIRLVPLIPWEIVNYASGLSRIKYRDYIAATMLGILPAVLIQTFFADRISNFDIKDPTIIIAIAGFILLIFVPTIYLALKKVTHKNVGAGLVPAQRAGSFTQPDGGAHGSL